MEHAYAHIQKHVPSVSDENMFHPFPTKTCSIRFRRKHVFVMFSSCFRKHVLSVSDENMFHPFPSKECVCAIYRSMIEDDMWIDNRQRYRLTIDDDIDRRWTTIDDDHRLTIDDDIDRRSTMIDRRSTTICIYRSTIDDDRSTIDDDIICIYIAV